MSILLPPIAIKYLSMQVENDLGIDSERAKDLQRRFVSAVREGKIKELLQGDYDNRELAFFGAHLMIYTMNSKLNKSQLEE
jgi:hypothetical protein